MKFHRSKLAIKLSGAVSVAAMLAASQAALAQDSASEEDKNIIVVTATKRDANLQDIPFSINAQTADDIQKSGAVTLEDLSRNVAGLAVQNLGPGQSQVSIRGISAGQVVRDQPGVKEQVGIYLDESVISLSLFTPDLDLFDLNRVETLRGPQGTLFGSGSIGGTIRYITNQPNLTKIEGSIEGDINLVDGDDLGFNIKGAVNVPLVEDKIALRAVGYYTQFGGFINARGPGGAFTEDVNDGERYGGRLALTLKPTEDVTITPRVIYQEISTDGFNRQETFNIFANPFTTTVPPVTLGEREQFLLLDEEFQDETFIADLVINAEFSGVTLTSVTSYSDREILVSRDATALTSSVVISPFIPLFGFNPAAALLPSNLRDTTQLDTFTQELRLASDNDSRFQWVLGGFYSDVNRDYAQRLPTPGYAAFQNSTTGGIAGIAPPTSATANGFDADSPFNSDLAFDLEQFAFFAEASFQFTDRLTFTAGGRYYDFTEDRVITSGGIFANGDTNAAATTTSDGFTPRFLISYNVADDITLNAQASRGFRLGGVNDPLNAGICNARDLQAFSPFQLFDDETLWNYELGLKAKIGGFTFNAAGFYTDVSDLQVNLDAGSCSSRVSINVEEAHTLGIEWEFSGEVVNGLDIGISGSALEAEVDSNTIGPVGPIPGLQSGDRLPSVPEFQVSANATYSWPIGPGDAFVAASFQYVGDRITQPGDQFPTLVLPATSTVPFLGATGNEPLNTDPQLPSYELVNISAGVKLNSQLDITAAIRNLFDTNPLLSFDRERGGRARTGFNIGQPRTFSITARQKF